MLNGDDAVMESDLKSNVSYYSLNYLRWCAVKYLQEWCRVTGVRLPR